jgi:oligopeptide/dipeptide ABC transporter ATP-binding protein
LLRAVPEPGAVHVPLPGDPPSAIDPPTGCAFHPRCALATEVCGEQTPELVVSAAGGHVTACHHQDGA